LRPSRINGVFQGRGGWLDPLLDEQELPDGSLFAEAPAKAEAVGQTFLEPVPSLIVGFGFSRS
jgi:hypothetical protein